MATPRFEQATYTLNRVVNGVVTPVSVYLKYILCNDKEIVLRPMNPRLGINQTNYYGINGTFYEWTTDYLTGISIYDGASIRDYGYQNGGAIPHKMGTYVIFKYPVGNMRGFVDQIDVYEGHIYSNADGTYTMSTSDVLWAVGGMSLYTTDTDLTESDYYKKLNEEVDSSVKIDEYKPRTAVIYIGGPTAGLNTVLLNVHGSDGDDTGHLGVYLTDNNKGVTMWELRSIINDYFGAMLPTPSPYVYMAVALDGGGSTCIRAKDSNGQDVVYSPVIDQDNRTRMMRSLLTVDWSEPDEE